MGVWEIKLLLIYVYMVEFYGLLEMENSCQYMHIHYGLRNHVIGVFFF